MSEISEILRISHSGFFLPTSQVEHCSKSFIFHQGHRGHLEPLPSVIGQRQGDALVLSPAHDRDCRRRLENHERTNTDTGRTCKPHIDGSELSQATAIKFSDYLQYFSWKKCTVIICLSVCEAGIKAVLMTNGCNCLFHETISHLWLYTVLSFFKETFPNSLWQSLLASSWARKLLSHQINSWYIPPNADFLHQLFCNLVRDDKNKKRETFKLWDHITLAF